MRKAAYQIKNGQVGTVKEVHIWTNRPIWPQGGQRAPVKPVPPTLNWEAWIGPAQLRPYADGYHPFAWRGWWDFGTGALGDMACHTCNMPFMALNMRDPISVEADCPEHDGDSYPPRSKIKFEFPELDGRAAFTMNWYDGGNLPANELFKGVTLTTKDDKGKEVQPPCTKRCADHRRQGHDVRRRRLRRAGRADCGRREGNGRRLSHAARVTKKNGSSP